MSVFRSLSFGCFGWALSVASPVAATPAQGEATDEGTTRFVALAHIDWVIHRQSSEDDVDRSTGAPLNEDRFVLRRARAGYVYEREHFAARGELELTGEREYGLSPYELSLVARADTALDGERLAGALSLGLFRIPFGHDVMERAEERPVLERTAFAKALFPGQRDLGVGGSLRFGALRAAVAWMNGEPLGEGRFRGLDATRMKDIVGRVGFEAAVLPRITLSGGVSGLSGQGLHPGTRATKDRLAWNDGNEDGLVELSELSVVPGVPATAAETFSRFALGADARLVIALPVLGNLEIRGEIVRTKNLDRGLEPADPVARGRDLRELGYCLGAAQELTRHAEIAFRYDVYDPDTDARRQRAFDVVPVDARYHTYAFALAGKVRHFRALFEYDHRRNALGVTAAGVPATLSDDSFTLRGEFVY